MDIGGANTKAAWLDGESLRTVSRPFEVWRDREALAAVLRDVAAEVAAGPADAVAITMTAELVRRVPDQARGGGVRARRGRRTRSATGR